MLYEVNWQILGDALESWFGIYDSEPEALVQYDALDVDMIAEIEDVPIIVAMYCFEPLAKDGTPLQGKAEDIAEDWYTDGPKSLISCKTSAYHL